MPLAPLIPPSRLDVFLKDIVVPDALKREALEWADRLTNYQGGVVKEQQNRSQFLSLLFERGLGYRPNGAVAVDQVFDFREEQKTELDADRPDASIGRFGGRDCENATYAVVELKDSSEDLDKAPKGPYAMSPVQQGFSYADKHVHAEFILVSNFKEIRLYAREARQLRAWRFEFHRLNHEDRDRLLKELTFFLCPAHLLPDHPGGRPKLLDLIQAAPLDQEKITRAFYTEFRTLRDTARQHYERLLKDLDDPNPAPKALQAAQKLLDRTLFAGFAQSRHLLPDGLLAELAEHFSRLEEKPIHRNLMQLFKHLDKGFRRAFVGTHTDFIIPGFNGGLFRPDPVVDNPELSLTEDLSRQLLKLADKDFVTELPVSILGHCFESSLGELDQTTDQDTRHEHGIYYTPDWVTRYLCRQVLGPLVARCRTEAMDRNVQVRGPRPEGDEEAQAHWDLEAFHALWEAISRLNILDPACGSGAFLAMGLRVLRDLLEPDYRLALALASNLPETRDEAHEDFPGLHVVAHDTPRSRALARIQDLPGFERCFFGVDLHPEAVMLAQLSLWLETARKDRKLSDLSDRLKSADSLASDWHQLFPGVTFDAILGNPPYVRMELFKDQKPNLRARFAHVHEERADLYCYFFQLSLELLKEGGRYGIIVSNKWLRAKYGAPSRAYLKSNLRLERILDFGELPVFEAAAVMPVILVGEKLATGQDAALRFCQIATLPATDLDLETVEAQKAVAVPPEQLGAEAWLLVDAAKGAVFASRKTKGMPLREYLGDIPICWGIKTGLNEAFWINQDQRDALVAKNPEARELIKPLVIGDEVRRWTIRQDEPRFLIYTPKNRYEEAEFRDRFPAVAAHLEPFRSFTKNGKTVGLDHRATKQAWFELQQAQEAYEQYFSGPKILWPFIGMEPRFCAENGSAINNNTYAIPSDNSFLLGFLNATGTWQTISNVAASLGNPSDEGRTLLYEHTMENLIIPPHSQDVADKAKSLGGLAASFESHRHTFTRFLRHDAPWCCAPLGEGLEHFWNLDQAAVLAEALKRRDKKLKEPTPGDRDYLLKAWREVREPMLDLHARIQKLETELDRAVDAAWGEA